MRNHIRPFSYLPAPERVFVNAAFAGADTGIPIASTTGTFSMVGDIAVPDDLVALGIFQGLQRTLNEAARRSDATINPLTVDGEIGRGTFAAAVYMAEVMRQGGGDTFRPPSVASLAESARSWAVLIAGYWGFSPDFTPDPRNVGKNAKIQVATSTSGGGSAPAPGSSDSLAPSSWLNVGKALLVGGLVAGAAYWAMKKNKRTSRVKPRTF